MSESKAKAPMFAIVELFGHARIAGAVSEQTFGGSTFVRVDVPAVTLHEPLYERRTPDGGYEHSERTIPAHTRSFGPGAIYSINWCDEETARIAAQSIRHEPMRPYSVREALEHMPADQRNRLVGGPRDDEQY